MELFDQIEESTLFIKNQLSFLPDFGVILGTGLNDLADNFENVTEIPYDDIPHFPTTTVKGHKNKLVIGMWKGLRVIVMAGRFHYYEGYSMEQVTFPVRVLKTLGIRLLVISNAAGSTNENINAGDLVFIKDHISFHHDNPLRGKNDDRLGPRFPDMSNTYNRELNQKALDLAHSMGVPAHEGVYVGLPGPNLETPAEYKFINLIGGDVVGMSTIPEVLVAKHMSLPVFVVSVATNQSIPIQNLKPVTIDEVISISKKTEPSLSNIVYKILEDFIAS